MANKTRIYDSKDWNIWTYVPEPESFILDFSQLNGPDVLGTTGGGLQILEADIASISITEGSEVSQGIFHEYSPPSMNATLLIKNFVAEDSQKFLFGSEIAVTLKNEANVPMDVFGFNTPYFIGRIRSFMADVQPGSDFATVNISATSKSEDDLNTLITIPKDAFNFKKSLIAVYAGYKNIICDFDNSGEFNFANNVTETKSFGEWIQDLQLCDLTILNDIYVGPEKRLKTFSSTVGSPIWTFDESQIFGTELNWSGSESPTSVTLTNYANNNLVYQFGDSLQQIAGANNYQGTVDVKDLTQMILIGQKMLSMSKTFRPISISTSTAKVYEPITFFDNDPVSPFTLNYLVNTPPVGSTVNVNLDQYNFTNVPMLITGRIMEITPDTWTTTYNLWKGFTN